MELGPLVGPQGAPKIQKKVLSKNILITISMWFVH